MTIKARCRIIRTVKRNEDWVRFGVLPLENKEKFKINSYGNFTISGQLTFLDEGEEYVIEFEEGKTTSFGTEYIVKSVPSLMVEELTDETELQYLERITTPSQAKYVHDAYPDFIRRVLKGEEETIDVNKIFNVGDYRLAVYIREINEKFKYFNIIALYPHYNFTMDEVKSLSKTYKDMDTIKNKIETEPYSVLIEALGRRFCTDKNQTAISGVDKMIIDYEESYITSEQRTEFMLLWLLGRNEQDGNTKIYANALAEYIREYDKRLLPLVKSVSINSDRIYFDDETKDIARMDTYMAECNIADFIKAELKLSNKLDITDIEQYREVDGFKATDKQFSLLDKVINHGVSVLAGFAGTGKTTSIKMLIKMLEDNGLTYVIITPTGASAKVVTKATGRPASTIHKLLARLEGGLIYTDVVIVDEMSMVGVGLMSNLISSIDPTNTRLVLSGDPAQLNSISCGLVFKNIIDSGIVPVTLLDEVFRYKDDGVLNVATNTRQGKSFFKSEDSVQKYGKNFKFIQASNSNTLDILMEEYRKTLKKVKHYDIMVLSPMNVGNLGTYTINKEIQSEVNPPRAKEFTMVRKIEGLEIVFRKGDFVLNTMNDYKAVTLEEYNRIEEIKERIIEEVGEVACAKMRIEPDNYVTIVNGDKGIIRSIDEKKMVVQIDEEMIVFTRKKLNQLLHGWCITTHKSQGQGNDYVICVLSRCHERMLNRELLYVAETRSSEKMTIIGDMETIENGIKISSQDDRNTSLYNLLLEQNIVDNDKIVC